jgi:glycosyltransferase involved in cell wall biosynthesis
MRILNVTESYAPFYEFGGPPVKVRALSEGLAARGHEVTVLTADWALEVLEKKAPPAKPSEHCPFGWRREERGVRAIYLPNWLRYRALSWNPAVKRFCRARLRDFDVVHIFGLYDLLGPAVASFCRKCSLPYLVEPMGMFVPIVRNFHLKRIYHAMYGRKLFAGAAAMIATAAQEAEELVRGGIVKERIVMRRNGVMAPEHIPARGSFRSSQEIPAEARVVLFLGRLSLKKSPDLLLQAFASLPSQIAGKELYLAYVGPDESGMKAHLETTAARAGIANRVRFSGPLYEEGKWAAYRDADVFVLPSQNENFGNTAAEAAAVGTPVIVTEQCGIAPLLNGVAAIVIAHDQNTLARALEKVLSDWTLHARLAEGGKEIAMRLGWEEPVRQMETLYTTLAATKPADGQSSRRE